MVRRSNMWRWFYNKFGDLSEPANLERAINTLSRYRRLDSLEPNWPRIRSEFASGDATYGRLFDLLHRHHAERLGRPRWGDKSLHSEFFAAGIYEEFPDARVVHMVRDPRDRYASIAHRYAGESKGIASATGRWLRSAHAAESNQRRYGERYLTVRFEDLATDPVAIVTRVCEHIGEDFVSEMMAMQGAPEHDRGNSSFGDLAPSTISAKPIGRYRAALSESEIAFIQLATGRVMRRHRYELDPVDLRGVDRLSFALGSAPLDLSRMAFWSVRDRLGGSRSTVPTRRLVEAQP